MSESENVIRQRTRAGVEGVADDNDEAQASQTAENPNSPPTTQNISSEEASIPPPPPSTSSSSSSAQRIVQTGSRNRDHDSSTPTVLSPLMAVILILGVANAFLLLNVYQSRGKAIKYERTIGELELEILEKDLALKDTKSQLDQQSQKLTEKHERTLEEVKRKLDEVAGKHEKENLELKTKNGDLELALARLKNFYMKEDGDTELHLAAYWKDEEAVKQLVQKDSDLDRVNNLLQTPLHKAALGRDKRAGLRIIKYLIANGADVSKLNHRTYTFLHELVESGTTLTPSQFHDIAVYLISKKYARLFDIPGWLHGSTPLQLAVRDFEVEPGTLSLLHKNGVNFNAKNKMGNSLLTYAAEGMRTRAFLTSLVKYGLDWRQLNNNNQSLLYIAAEFCNLEAVKFFFEKGGLDVNAVDNAFGNTPLHIAVQNARRQEAISGVAEYLIEKGANLKIFNKAGLTPLQIVLKRENMADKFKVVELLIKSEKK